MLSVAEDQVADQVSEQVSDKVSDRVIDVEQILASTSRSIQVEKDVPLTFDVGSLAAFDMAPIETTKLGQGKARDLFLKDLTRDNTQLLFNALFSLPTTTVERSVCVDLPAPTTRLPREKPVPPPQSLTKWEAFAKRKGIHKKKRGRMIWDDVAKEWKPRFGYKKVGGDKEQNWVVEVPENGDPYKDWLGEKVDAKKENVAKNELKRLQNISKQVKDKSDAIGHNVKQAHKSTASLGKFQDSVKHEKRVKEKGKQRKFSAVSGDGKSEKESSLALISKISSNMVSVNKEKAGNKELGATIKRKREEEREGRKPARRSKAGTKLQSKHFDKKKGQVSRPAKGKSREGGPAQKKAKR